ncbi:MAG: DUF885 domain-containing protein, partial [Proteobacteria bacterium]|nr:DUF885 domain-containing protein [Pseudomonadota bacterium]
MRAVGKLAAIVAIAATCFTCSPARKPVMQLKPTLPSPLAAEAVAGITDPTLRRAVGDHWEYLMRWAPTYATTLGDHRYVDQRAPRDAGAIARAAVERDAILGELEAIEPASLGEVDRITHRLLRDRLAVDRALDVCFFHEWKIDSDSSSAFGELTYLVESHTVTRPEDATNLVARMGQGARQIDDTIANLTSGLRHGRVAAAGKVHRAIAQLDTELARPVGTWSMATPAWAAQHPHSATELRRVVAEQIQPALIRYRDFLRTQVLPHARSEQEGLVGLVDGAACYRATILEHVGLPMTPEELHALGTREIARTDRELAELGSRVLQTPDLASTIARLRTDRALYFTTREEILAVAQRSLDRAKAAVPSVFSTIPKTDCVMREVPAYEAPYTTIAYYRQPHYDGSKPGEYFVNTYQP